MLARLAEFVYTIVLKPPLLRYMANAVIRRLLPGTVRYGEAVVALNPKDPVISGALLFRVYEVGETRFLNTHLKPGSLFIDIGANVGYYTALAQHKIGDAGDIIALEPDPDSYHYLERTVALNPGEARVQQFRLAAGRREEEVKLYISDDNRGDNRLYDPGNASASINIRTMPLEHIVRSVQLPKKGQPLFIKIDVQGAEGEVIDGAHTLFRGADELTLMMEFWPQGLREMSSDPAGLLDELESLGLALFELADDGTQLTPIVDKADLVARHPGRKYTNIIGIKQRAAA